MLMTVMLDKRSNRALPMTWMVAFADALEDDTRIREDGVKWNICSNKERYKRFTS
jgi:hypothetical protein